MNNQYQPHEAATVVATACASMGQDWETARDHIDTCLKRLPYADRRNAIDDAAGIIRSRTWAANAPDRATQKLTHDEVLRAMQPADLAAACRRALASMGVAF